MNTIKLFIRSRIKKIWRIKARSLGKLIQIEVTTPPFFWADADDLRINVIAIAFKEIKHLAVSQYVDRDQWDIGEDDIFLRDITDNFSLPVILTKGFDTSEFANLDDKTFVVNTIGYSEINWLRKLIRFGMTNNPNILYGLESVIENWGNDIISWNSRFRKWFDLEGGESDIEKIVEQVDLFGWTGDGHIYIYYQSWEMASKLLEKLSILAKERSLTTVIESDRRAGRAPA